LLLLLLIGCRILVIGDVGLLVVMIVLLLLKLSTLIILRVLASPTASSLVIVVVGVVATAVDAEGLSILIVLWWQWELSISPVTFVSSTIGEVLVTIRGATSSPVI